MKKILFVAEERHLHSPIPGGVQLCTREYAELLEKAGYQIIYCPIKHTRKLRTRIRLKLGIELYSRYDFTKYAITIAKLAKEHETSIVALNQVDLMGFAPLLKKQFACKIILLSHGNESGDFLHEITRSNYHPFLKRRDIIRLGAVIYKESYYFIHHIDAVLSVSETEKEINNWLGANNSIFIPRTYKPFFLDWKPVLGRVGFVGTLNHKPNIDGLMLLLDEIKKNPPSGLEFRIVGGPASIGKKLEKQYPFVTYIGFIDDNKFQQEAASWSLFVNPIFWYSRGVTTKLAQAINWGLPIISTEPGNRGYALNEAKPLTASSPKHMANLIVENIFNSENLNKLAILTQNIAQTGPDIEGLGNRITKILEDV